MSTSTCTSWARLISQDPDQKDILFPTKPNEPKYYTMNDEWIIYQSAETSTVKIANFSASKIKIDFTCLKKNEEQILIGGEMITFSDQKKKNFDYIFVLMRESRNPLKRTLLRKDPPVTVLKKSAKVQKGRNLKEDPPCPICQEILYNPVKISPCSHRFCSGCLSENIKFSTKCPICRKEITSFQKDPSLSHPSMQRSEEERLSLDEKDLTFSHGKYHKSGDLPIQKECLFSKVVLFRSQELISKGYKILREEDGVYFGELKNGKKHGEGKMTYGDGLIYQGTWKVGKQEGRGKWTWKNGNVYEGNFSNGRLIKSSVKITFSNGNVYSGEVEGLLMHGKGILTFHNGDQYRGEFVKGKIEGVGAYLFQNGDRYTGIFVNQMRNGYGEMVYGNGDVYGGHWKNDQKDGEGVFKYVQGLEFQGKWKNDESIGKGKFICGGLVFEGKWEKL